MMTAHFLSTKCCHRDCDCTIFLQRNIAIFIVTPRLSPTKCCHRDCYCTYFLIKQHARFRKVLSKGSNFDNVFLVEEGREDPNITKSGPSSACQRNAISMAFRWQADDGPPLYAGLVASGDPDQYCQETI